MLRKSRLTIPCFLLLVVLGGCPKNKLEVQKTHLAGARAQPDSRETGRRLQEAMALHLAGRLERQWKVKKQLRVLDAACKQKHPTACARARSVRALPRVKLVNAPARCGWAQWRGQQMVRVSSSGEVRWNKASASAPSEPILALDHRAPYSAVAAVIDTLRQRHGDGTAVVLLGQGDGTIRGVNVSFLRARGPAGKKPGELPGRKIGPGIGVGPGSRTAASGAWVGEPAFGLKVDHKQLHLAVDGATRIITAASSGCPAPHKTCVHRPALARRLQHVHASRPGLVVAYLDASPKTPWGDVAQALAVAKCASKDGSLAPVQKMVVLGPAPDHVGKPANNTLFRGPVNIAGALSKGEIKQVITANISQVTYCYQKQLANIPNLAGRVTVRFGINAKGLVYLAEVKSTTLNNRTVEQCILRAIRTWKFPKPRGGGIVYVVYPFVFKTTP